jgi:uncharacterized membrane protein YkoI
LDLLNLANSYVDALGHLKLARMTADETAKLSSQKAVSDMEAATAKTILETAELKVRLLHGIAETALRAAEKELELASQRVRAGTAPIEAASEAEGKVTILKLILESGR